MDTASKVKYARQAIDLIGTAHDVEEKEVRAQLAEVRKHLDAVEAAIPASRKAFAERTAAEAKRRSDLKSAAARANA